MSVDRGFTWMDDETIALIDIFGKDEIQQELHGSKRNIGVYERIAKELSDVGFRRTAYQCREKIKRLRKEYHLAKYYIENNLTHKKPMKYFELADKLFNQDTSTQSNNIDLSSFSSDHEDEIHLTFNPDGDESDASNSCTTSESFVPLSILTGPSSSPLQNGDCDIKQVFGMTQDSSNNQNDSDDTLLNGEKLYDLSDKDSPNESPWVPNVVLVENDAESHDIDTSETQDFENTLNDSVKLPNIQASLNEQFFKDFEEPPSKKRKSESSKKWFKKMLDSVTETFLNHQESSDARFLERITQLEQERMKRDENMQRLWLEFEDRRRKEEQEHELKMLSLLGQFLQQVNGNENTSS